MFKWGFRWAGVDWIHLVQAVDEWKALSNGSSGFIKGKEFVEQLSGSFTNRI
jgi:hypothetical protein